MNQLELPKEFAEEYKELQKLEELERQEWRAQPSSKMHTLGPAWHAYMAARTELRRKLQAAGYIKEATML